MNKESLIEQISDTADLNKAQATRALDAVIDNITKALSDSDSVVIPGFGTFSVKDRAARMGRNPKTGEEIEIPESRVPHFKAGTKLKEAVKNTGAVDA